MYIYDHIDKYVDRYYNDVFLFVLSRTKNREDAEDITQNTFIKLMSIHVDFESEEHIKNWLIHVASNESKNLFKSANRKNFSLDESFILSSKDTTSAVDLRDLFMKLDPKYRDVMVLYAVEGFKAKEIAQILEIPQSTVLSRMKRGREKLEKLMGEGK